MSFTHMLLITATRAIFVALFATFIATTFHRYLTSTNFKSKSKRLRLSIYTAIIIPFLMPPLVIGFTWTKLGLNLENFFLNTFAGTSLGLWLQHQHVLIHTIIYITLLAMHLAPVGLLLLHMLPPSPISPTAAYCASLLKNKFTLKSKLRLRLSRSCANTFIVFIALTVFAFIDVDLNMLMQIPESWGLWLFDQQVVGLHLSYSIRYTLAATAVILPIILLAIFTFNFIKNRQPQIGQNYPNPPSKFVNANTACFLFFSLLLTTIIPLIMLLQQALDGGFTRLTAYGEYFSQIQNSAAYAIGGAGLAYLVAHLLYRLNTPFLTFIFIFPGLLGGLIIGLLFKQSFEWFYTLFSISTPFSAILGLACLLLPVASIFEWIYQQNKPATALYLTHLQTQNLPNAQNPALAIHQQANTIRGQRLQRYLLLRTRFASLLLLFWLGYFEMSCVGMLHPLDAPPAIITLQNLMHYGHSQVLAALTLTTIILPLITLLIITMLGLLYSRFQHNRLVSALVNYTTSRHNTA